MTELEKELYEALKAMVVMMDYDKPRKLDDALTWRSNDEKARAMADAAIAKAELEKEKVLSDEVLDKKMDLMICGWNGNPVHCVYLNNHRIVGTKPWGGGITTKSWNYLTIRELARAIPELRSALDLDYLGRPIAKAEAQQKRGEG